MKPLTRRSLLRQSILASGALLAGGGKFALGWPFPQSARDAFRGGQRLSVIDFSEELPIDMGTKQGSELDGRLYTDLSTLTSEAPIMPARDFYLRTCASNLLKSDANWTIRLGGLVRQPVAIEFEKLKRMEKPAGVHLMECAGNTREFHFGLMSAAEWSGVPLSEVLQLAQAEPRAARVLVSGFDQYQARSTSSIPGASWIFTTEELASSGAFLATQMNGEPLTRDHGAPVRLLVPGWYGCACIKWVDQIDWVENDADGTSQMQEYSARTGQNGVPKNAMDYLPAIIEPAATPIRIERWLVDGKIKFRIVGILWGGTRPVQALEIRFNPEEDYVPVDDLRQTGNNTWSFWTYAWTPKSAGTYLIRLRVKDAGVLTKRLDSGYYLRSVDLGEGDL
ncbi:MAG: molybdopterin-dependent oxidoreductase [Candidatus Acidiferrales bacterium]